MTIDQQKLRTLLIERASKERTISYEELSQALGVANNTPLYDALDQLSRSEHAEERPLLSAVVIHKGGSDQGNGFYALAEELGFGKKQQLMKALFGIEQINQCFDYWKNQALNAPPFFTSTDIELLAEWGNTPYDKNDPAHQAARERIKATCWAKSVHFAEQVCHQLEGFVVSKRESAISQGQAFFPYTWVRLTLAEHEKSGVHFSLGVSAIEVYCKVGYKYAGDLLTEDHKAALDNYMQTHKIELNRLKVNNLSGYDWDKLVDESRQYIIDNFKHYEQMIALLAQNRLREQVPPTQFVAPPPADAVPSFAPQPAKDHAAEATAKKKLGDAGEALVLLWERERLKQNNQKRDAKKVEKKADGEGYDILSFDEQGNEVYIEVKTTTQSAEAPFFMSVNEVDFARLHPQQYWVYRLYNYDETTNSADFFIIKNLHQCAEFRPTNFKVYITQ